MLDCIWNNEETLRAQAKTLQKQGYNGAAQGCLDRADKVVRAKLRFKGQPEKLAKYLREPVEL